MYTPVNASFTILKWGLRDQNYIGMFAWCNLDECFDYESSNSSEVKITLTPAVNSCKICISVLEEEEAVYMTHTYYSVSCIENFKGTVVR